MGPVSLPVGIFVSALKPGLDRAEEQGMDDITRTYEKHAIRWTCVDPIDGQTYTSRWTGYRSAAEAQATVDFAAERGSDRTGVVETTEFEVTFPADRADLYQPGIRERAGRFQS